MRVLVAGKKAFGAAVFESVRTLGVDIVAAAAPALAGDGERRDRLRVKAEDAGVRWIRSGTLNADTLPDGVDLIVCAHSHDFIGRKTLGRCRLGAIGYHPSLLPLHRGRDAVRWAVHMRERVTGGTVYWLSDNVDAGPIAAQEHVFIRPNDSAESLWHRELFPLGVRLIQRVVVDLLAGRMVRTPQDSAIATWEPSWSRPPLHRPDLDALGGGWEGMVVETDPRRRALNEFFDRQAP